MIYKGINNVGKSENANHKAIINKWIRGNEK